MPMSTGTAAQLCQESLVEAQQRVHIRLSENQESYLVFTLIRHMRDPHLLARIMALEFLDALDRVGAARDDGLRDVGDRCLLLAGLFPAVRHRRRVDATYFQQIGQSAYGVLGDNRRSALAQLYAELAARYTDLVRVLGAWRCPA